jgi:hypothetical protein
MRAKRVSPEQRRKEFKPTLFFGYGSLLRSEGINGKGMRHRYIDDEIKTARLYGFERSMCGYFGGRNFYGLLPKTDAWCNGVLFEIYTWDDYRTLLLKEGATSSYRRARTYWPIDVSANIKTRRNTEGYRTIALVCRNDKSELGHIPISYVRLCWMLASKWGKRFSEEFVKTGGIKYDKTKLLKLRREGNLNLW